LARQKTTTTAALRDRHAASEVLDGFRRILRELRVASSDTQASVGLSAAQLFVLAHLVDEAVLSIGELAERTLTDRSSVAAVVDRLVERGFVARTRADDDRRRAAIQITRAGRRLLKSAPAAPTDRLLDGLGEFTAKELAQFARLISRLVTAMGLEAEPATMLFEGDPQNGAPRKRVR
jgi:DNA-binding MarR family transcriptional regulator